jgi:hypothetical protein
VATVVIREEILIHSRRLKAFEKAESFDNIRCKLGVSKTCLRALEMPNRASTQRTRKQYKLRFFEEVMATAPAVILEVGCGNGAGITIFLRTISDRAA